MKTREQLIREDRNRLWDCHACHHLNSQDDNMCGDCTTLRPAGLRLDYDDVYRSVDAPLPMPWDNLGFKPGLRSGFGLSPDTIDDEEEMDEEQIAERRRSEKKKQAKTLRRRLTALFRK